MKLSAKSLLAALIAPFFLYTSCSEDDKTTPEVVPSIVSFSPSHAKVGTTVVITGTNFSATAANNIVSFNGTAATITDATPNQITTKVPENATTGKITIKVADKTATSATDFTVDATPSPTIVSFAPTHAAVGTTIVITGTNFNTTAASNTVTFNGVVATVTEASATQITTKVPATATTGKIVVKVGDQSATSATDFTIDAAPVVPNCILTKMTIVSTGFSDEDSNGTEVTNFTYNANNQLTQYADEQSTITYTYKDGVVTGIKDEDADGWSTTVETWTYNDKKLVSHIDGTITNSDKSTYTYTKDFTYNTDGTKLLTIKRQTTDDGVADYLMTFTYTGDNVTSYTAKTIANNEIFDTGTFSDFDNKNNPFLLLAKATGNQLFFISEVTSGEILSKNNAKTVKDPDYGDYTSTIEYNENDLPTKITSTYTVGKDVVTFEYSCK